MMGRRRHLGCRDTAGTVQGGKDLGKANHFAPDGGILFHNGHLEILVGQIQGCLEAGDTAPHYQCVEFYLFSGHYRSFRLS